MGRRSRPSVLCFGAVEGQGQDGKVFKVNTRVGPPEFSKSVADL